MNINQFSETFFWSLSVVFFSPFFRLRKMPVLTHCAANPTDQDMKLWMIQFSILFSFLVSVVRTRKQKQEWCGMYYGHVGACIITWKKHRGLIFMNINYIRVSLNTKLHAWSHLRSWWYLCLIINYIPDLYDFLLQAQRYTYTCLRVKSVILQSKILCFIVFFFVPFEL